MFRESVADEGYGPRSDVLIWKPEPAKNTMYVTFSGLEAIISGQCYKTFL